MNGERRTTFPADAHFAGKRRVLGREADSGVRLSSLQTAGANCD